MEKIKINKDAIIKSLTKMIADKKEVRTFLKGKSTAELLTKKGIQLAKPL